MSTDEDAMRSAVFALFDNIIIQIRMLERLSKKQEMAAIETENAKLLAAITKLSLDAEQCGAKLMTNPPICHRAHIARLALEAVSGWAEKP